MKYIPIALYDAVVVVTFAVLAVMFQKWWIVLFSALWIATSKDKE